MSRLETQIDDESIPDIDPDYDNIIDNVISSKRTYELLIQRAKAMITQQVFADKLDDILCEAIDNHIDSIKRYAKYE